MWLWLLRVAKWLDMAGKVGIARWGIKAIFFPLIEIVGKWFPHTSINMISNYYNASDRGKLIKDLRISNLYLSAFIYGVWTAAELITYIRQPIDKELNDLINPLYLTFSFILVGFPLYLFIFGRVHYPRSKRVNWRETFCPIKDFFIVWLVTTICTCLIWLFIVLISK